MDITYTLKSLYEITLSDMAALFTKAFEGYVGGHVYLTDASLSALLSRENIDLIASRVLLSDDAPVGFGFIARQGWSSRLSAMGVIPGMQGKGAGRWLLACLLAEACTRDDKSMTLEAFEQNLPAVSLYSRMGFHIIRRLYGFTSDPRSAPSAPQLSYANIADIGRQVLIGGLHDLPWQISGPGLIRLGTPMQGVACGRAFAVFTDTGDTLVLRAVYVPPDDRRQGEATRLIHALSAAYPQHKWYIPPLWPEEYAPFLEQLGFARMSLNQVHMVQALV